MLAMPKLRGQAKQPSGPLTALKKSTERIPIERLGRANIARLLGDPDAPTACEEN